MGKTEVNARELKDTRKNCKKKPNLPTRGQHKTQNKKVIINRRDCKTRHNLSLNKLQQ